MKIRKRLIVFIFTLFALPALALPIPQFTVKDIELMGAKRVTLATVVTYMPLKAGDVLTPRLAQDALRSLFKTGFFKDVRFMRRGENTLVIKVVERPAISEINIDGNVKVKTDDIEKAFSDAGLTRGQIYNDSVLEEMRRELQRLYYSLGRYGVKLETKVTDLSRNRVKIDIEIKEGLSAKIKLINIIGNTAFNDEELMEDFESGIPSFWAIFSSKDEYSRNKLSGDLEILSSYYLDRGYVNFLIDSTQVTITPDKKDIYITINVIEGDLYTISGSKLAGKMVVPEKRIKRNVDFYIRKGEHFSRKNITDAEDSINKYLGNLGYAFSEVNVIPEINEETKEVDLIFNIDAGRRAYVRRISFVGNEKTLDSVYRRELRQMEGSWYSGGAIERSRVRIQRLPYVQEVSFETPLVDGTDDQIDVVYTLKERLSGTFNVGAGYSDLYGTTFNISLSQSNLFGSGNSLSTSFINSRFQKSLSMFYVNPYYTSDGISRSLSASFREINTGNFGISTPYVHNTAGAGMGFSIPISEYSMLSLGMNVSTNEVVPIPQPGVLEINGTSTLVYEIADEVRDFLLQVGHTPEQINATLPFDFNTYKLTAGYFFDTRNRTIFPTSGGRQSISLELVPGVDIKYYKLAYRGSYYWPITKRTTLLVKYDLGIGNGIGDLEELPFFEKSIAGGINSLRGFRARTIGPKDSLGYPIGGDLRTIGTFEYILPAPSKKAEGSARIGLFVDFGNVFDTIGDFDTNEFRVSVGIGARWLTPLGALVFSYAEPIKYNDGLIDTGTGFSVPIDRLERFQFSVGGQF